MSQLTKEELEEQRQTAKKVLIASYEMYERSIQDMLDTRNNKKEMYSEKETEKNLKLMKTMQQDVVERFVQLGFTEEELKNSVAKKGKKKKLDRTALEQIMKNETAKEEMAEYIEKMKNLDIMSDNENNKSSIKENINDSIIDEPIIRIEDVVKKQIEENKEETFTIQQTNYSNIGNRIQYDVVPLPSKGECYKTKLEKVPVGYLTAYDENLIVSPNLYKDGTFIDELLKSKIMNNKINADDLLPGDRDAIILWLRGTSYGTDFPVTATDSETGKQFDTTVDLTSIKAKEFKLKGDSDGYFDFVLPVSKDKIKFKFLTYKDLKKLNKIEENESLSVKKKKVSETIEILTSILEEDDKTDKQVKVKATESIRNLEKYADNLTEDNEKSFTHAITNKLAMSIMSVNDITDRKFINEYVIYMNVKDSSALRKYITDNEPGLDFNVQVERPESLGGGSVNMFLTLDQFIFLNIA